MGSKSRVNKNSFLGKIAKRVMPYALAAGIGLATISCQQPTNPQTSYNKIDTEVISLETSVLPSTIQSGNYGEWELIAENIGYDCTITDATVEEQVIEGWESAPQYSPNNYIKEDITYLLKTTIIPSGSNGTKLLDFYFQALDNPPIGTPSNIVNLVVKDTINVTFNTNGGQGHAYTTFQYTITPPISDYSDNMTKNLN